MKFGVFQLGEVVFDPRARTLTHRDGRPAPLRHKSKAVLARLLDSPNRTVSKEEMLREVWAGTHVTDESLVQCIADIRRLVGRDARSIVETVPREGYRINLPPPSRAPHLALLAALGIGGLAVAGWLLWPQGAEVARAVAPAPAEADPPGTTSTEAFLEVLKGRASANTFSQHESLIAERHFRRAIALDPDYARAHGELGTLLAIRFENAWTVLQQADREKALFFAERAVALDPGLSLGHYALGRLHSVFGHHEVAEDHLRTAMSLQPDDLDIRAYLGIVTNMRGQSLRAVEILSEAVTAHPDPPYWYYLGLGFALFNEGRDAEALRVLSRCRALAPDSPYCLRYMIALHGRMGALAEAAAAIDAYRGMGFEPSVSSIMALMTFHHDGARAGLRDGLSRAGLPL